MTPYIYICFGNTYALPTRGAAEGLNGVTHMDNALRTDLNSNYWQTNSICYMAQKIIHVAEVEAGATSVVSRWPDTGT
jgi:hypothetical protein